MIAGCAFAVSRSSFSGPPKTSLDSGRPSASSTSWKTDLAASDESYSCSPMPTACEP